MGMAAAMRSTGSQAVVVGLIAAAILAYSQAPASGMYGYDGRFHIRYSQLLRQDLADLKGFPHEFPWWQETFLKDRFADKDLLYHLLLAPFTLGDLESGGKVASIFFGSLLVTCLYLAIRWARAPAPALWAVGCLLSSTALLYRAGLVRSHVVAIAIALLGAAAILRGSRAGIFISSALYALTHIAWHLLPGIALVHDGARFALTRRLRPMALPWSLAGTATAALTSPYFPDNLRLWYVQNVEVLAMAWSPSSPDLWLGKEILPGPPIWLVWQNLGPALLSMAGLLMALARSPRTGMGAGAPADASDGARARGDSGVPGGSGLLALGLVTFGSLALSLMSRRFVELWAPFSAMFAAVACGRLLEDGWKPPAASRWAAAATLATVAAGLGAHDIAQVRGIVAVDPGRPFDACAIWIRDHVPTGQTVFTTDWDEFPDLYFVAPEQRYLVGLDPTFMYVTDPRRWGLWRDIVEGRVDDVVEPIRGTFRCRYLFADAGHEEFVERADQNPWLRCEIRDPDCGVYTIPDEPPGQTLDDLVLEPWHLAGGGVQAAGRRDFVDVGRLVSGAAGEGAAGAATARVSGRLLSHVGREVVIGFSTDDPIQVELNGRLIFDSLVAEALSLDDVLHQHRAGSLRSYERRLDAALVAGPNDLTVVTQRAGRAWGFFIRFLEPS